MEAFNQKSGDEMHASEQQDDLDSGSSNSLEAPSPNQTIRPTTAIEPDGQNDSGSPSKLEPGSQPKPSTKKLHFQTFWKRFNIYLLLFILIVIIAIAVVVILYIKDKSANKASQSTISSQNLSASALAELANNGIQVGDPKQVLNIQSNSVFAGTVLVKGELQVAGAIKVGGGNLTLPSINVAGSGSINKLQTQDLSVAGNAAVQGQLTIQKSLSVVGGGTFTGPISTPQLTAAALQMNGDLVLTHHIVAGGPIPTRANGGALGAGGTSSVSGSDTAGSISIHTGGSTASGCFATVTFARSFASTPHVIIAPVGSAAGGLKYYVNRSTTNFSICVTSPAPASQSFGFDYIIFD